MSTFVFILLVLFGLSLLCALLMISAAVVSSRSSKRLAAKGLIDPTEELSALAKPEQTENPAPKKRQDQTTTRMAV